MTYVTLDEAKEQVSIEISNTSHDDRLTRLITAAETWAKNFLNANLEDYELSGESPPALPEDIKSAILLHIELEFDRDERNFELLLKRAHDMLWPYRTGLEV